MPRRPRRERRLAFHHVTNRGINKGAVFQTSKDARYFLACLACIVRKGWIRLIAYSVMTTHYHLFVQSLDGRVGRAIGYAANRYSRRTNRLRRRDGTMYRGRFYSTLVDSEVYARNAVRYSDSNPVHAGMVRSAAEFPWGSARYHSSGERPPWLDGRWIDLRLRGLIEDGLARDAAYQARFGKSLSERKLAWIERRMAQREAIGDDGILDDLLSFADARTRRWLEWKCQVGDGSKLGYALCDPSSVRDTIVVQRLRVPGAILDVGAGRHLDLCEVLEVGLLRDLAALTFSEVAHFVGTSLSTARRRYLTHRNALRGNEMYLDVATASVHEALAMCHGGSAAEGRT